MKYLYCFTYKILPLAVMQVVIFIIVLSVASKAGAMVLFGLITYNMLFFPTLIWGGVLSRLHNQLGRKYYIIMSIMTIYPIGVLFMEKLFEKYNLNHLYSYFLLFLIYFILGIVILLVRKSNGKLIFSITILFQFLFFNFFLQR